MINSKTRSRQRSRSGPARPISLVNVGFKAQGKTTYLAALTMVLEIMDPVWHGYSYLVRDDYTLAAIRSMRAEAQAGAPSAPTNPNAPLQPLVMSVSQIPQLGSFYMQLYDTPGEFYSKMETVGQKLAILKDIRNIWFMVSLADLEESPRDGQPHHRIADLFAIYLNGIQRLTNNAPLDGRNLIVIYTKADKLNKKLPADVREYLGNDPLRNLTRNNSPDERAKIVDYDFDMDDYLTRMQEISTSLETFTRREVSGGGAFINQALEHGMNVYFTATSALGGDPDPAKNRMLSDYPRYRVIDPYLWALALSTDKPLTVRLVLDAAATSDRIYQDGIIQQVLTHLRSFGEVATYNMGRTRPVAASGQTPPQTKPEIARPRLIGPLLDSFDPEDVVVVVTTGEIDDLDDYRRTHWNNQLMLVSVGQAEYQTWNRFYVIRSTSDIPGFYQHFFEFTTQELAQL